MRAGKANLTSKKWAIRSLISEGSTNVQIAASTHVPKLLVKDYLRRILDKTGCWNRTEIALRYLRIGVEQERRFSDRRAASSTISDDRRRGRRHSPQRSRRANEQHDVNLDE